MYREQLDDIVGMVHIKDVFAYVGRPEAFSLEAILRRPLMVAPQMPVLDLLLQMRQQRMHLALVVDEYGGIDGLVTIEDLVETIVGDIADEHDEVQAPMVTERADGALDINARLPVEEFEERHGAGADRGRARRGYRHGGRAGVHAGRAGAGEGRGDQPSVGHRVPRAGCGSAADPAGAGAAGAGADRGCGGGVISDGFTPEFVEALSLLGSAMEEVTAASQQCPVLVGGAALQLWTSGRYVSGDFDLVGVDPKPMEEALIRRGFRREDRRGRLKPKLPPPVTGKVAGILGFPREAL